MLFVSQSTGNDSTGTGTRAAPFATLEKAANTDAAQSVGILDSSTYVYVQSNFTTPGGLSASIEGLGSNRPTLHTAELAGYKNATANSRLKFKNLVITSEAVFGASNGVFTGSGALVFDNCEVYTNTPSGTHANIFNTTTTTSISLINKSKFRIFNDLFRGSTYPEFNVINSEVLTDNISSINVLYNPSSVSYVNILNSIFMGRYLISTITANLANLRMNVDNSVLIFSYLYGAISGSNRIPEYFNVNKSLVHLVNGIAASGTFVDTNYTGEGNIFVGSSGSYFSNLTGSTISTFSDAKFVNSTITAFGGDYHLQADSPLYLQDGEFIGKYSVAFEDYFSNPGESNVLEDVEYKYYSSVNNQTGNATPGEDDPDKVLSTSVKVDGTIDPATVMDTNANGTLPQEKVAPSNGGTMDLPPLNRVSPNATLEGVTGTQDLPALSSILETDSLEGQNGELLQSKVTEDAGGIIPLNKLAPSQGGSYLGEETNDVLDPQDYRQGKTIMNLGVDRVGQLTSQDQKRANSPYGRQLDFADGIVSETPPDVEE